MHVRGSMAGGSCSAVPPPILHAGEFRGMQPQRPPHARSEMLEQRRSSALRWAVLLVGTCACLIAGAVAHAFASARPDISDRRPFSSRRLDEQHERRRQQHETLPQQQQLPEQHNQQPRRLDDENSRRLQRRGITHRGGGGVGGKKRFALDPPSSATAAAAEVASAGGHAATGFDPNSNVCLLTIMTQERMASLHRMLYQWDGYVSIALLVDSYDDAAGEQRTRGR